MRLAILFCSAVFLAGCGSKSDSTSEAAYVAPSASGGAASKAPASAHAGSKVDLSDPVKRIQVIDVGQEAISKKLRDPNSAQFRDVNAYDGGGTIVACGWVNGKNGFGGMNGFERFIAAGDQIAVLESDMASPAEMDAVWSQFCR